MCDRGSSRFSSIIDTDESKWNASHLELSQVAMQLESMTQFQYAQSIIGREARKQIMEMEGSCLLSLA